MMLLASEIRITAFILIWSQYMIEAVTHNSLKNKPVIRFFISDEN